MTIAAGSHLGPYEIIARIGEGGMGVVYSARDPRLDRQVAIKVLPAGMTGDKSARERLRREAMAAAALDHPYICKVFEIGEHDDQIFLVMEFITGETLHRRMKNDRIPLPDATRVAIEICEALEMAHSRQMLHRDLKPANIMLTEQGHVKIMDFGLAKRLTEMPATGDATIDSGEGQLTAPGSIIGTPDYMSPEQVKGMPLDVRSDQFSLGAVLAEMFGGQHPFRKETTVETLSAVLREPPEISYELPLNLMRVVRRMLAKSAGDRYPSITDVRIELARPMDSAGSSATIAAEAEKIVAQTPAAKKWMWPALGIAGIVVALAAFFALRSELFHGAVAPHGIQSIAVLPLDNHSGDPAQDYFAEGMTDELTADLATISAIRVISRGSAMQFKGDHRPPTPEIAKTLNVDAVVEGSVLRSGDKVRITAELIDARADKSLWAKSFERNSRDVLALQDELASAIANEIHVQLTPAEASQLKSAPTVNPDAYDAYLKGRYFFNRPSDENLSKSIEQFESAVKLNPNFAPAYSGLSDAYLWAAFNQGVLTAKEAGPKAKDAAEKAVQLDANSAEAQTSLAVYKAWYVHDWAGAEQGFRRAFALNPNYAFAHDQFGLILAMIGRADEAAAEGERAAVLDPLDPQIPIDDLIGDTWRGNDQRAREQAKRAAELDPTFFFPVYADGWIDIEQGKVKEAIPAIRKSMAMDAPTFVTAWLGYAYGASGDRANALAEIEDLKKKSLHGYVPQFDLAIIYLGLGDRVRALDYLEQAYAADSQWMMYLKEDRIFDPLRKEPRFVALIKKMHFDQ